MHRIARRLINESDASDLDRVARLLHNSMRVRRNRPFTQFSIFNRLFPFGCAQFASLSPIPIVVNTNQQQLRSAHVHLRSWVCNVHRAARDRYHYIAPCACGWRAFQRTKSFLRARGCCTHRTVFCGEIAKECNRAALAALAAIAPSVLRFRSRQVKPSEAKTIERADDYMGAWTYVASCIVFLFVAFVEDI